MFLKKLNLFVLSRNIPRSFSKPYLWKEKIIKFLENHKYVDLMWSVRRKWSDMEFFDVKNVAFSIFFSEDSKEVNSCW